MTAAPLPAGIDGGLQLDQAPPLAVPGAFFVTGPAALVVAGVVLAATGAPALLSPWAPVTLASVHLGTLGFLAMVMFGALYQMTPVVAGAPVPAVRLGHAVHALLTGGVATFAWGLAAPSRGALLGGLGALALALLLFALPVGVALVRAPTRTATVWGMRLALLSLVVAALLGLEMAGGHAGHGFPGPRGPWVQVHLTWAVIGWVGGLIVAVSWQVVPMFYLAPALGPRSCGLTVGALAVGLVGASAGLGAGPNASGWAALGAAPAVLAVWGLQPVLILDSLRKRRRKRVDPSYRFWQAAMGVALVSIVAAGVALRSWNPRAPLLLGWLALWGWAAMVIHGMLTRIVPFLVWWHRFSGRVGRAPVPSMRSLYPREWVQRGLIAHGSTLLIGVGAILSGNDLLARATGAGLAATGLLLGTSLSRTLARRPTEAIEADAPRG